MYTTKEFEQATVQKGYELERISYTTHMTVRFASGFVFTDQGKKTVYWDYSGRAFNGDKFTPEYDLFEQKENEENPLD
ncbi:MAG: hypothetical protein LBV74_12280 [Tannerella sp.]|jgi:hypothetical protein|nr:hypothetical protein [Tannerella sp.]